MKYARIAEGRVLDFVDTAAYNPRPEWGQTDAALINRIFEAVGGFAAFQMIPDYVQPYEEVADNGEFMTDAAHNEQLRQQAETVAFIQDLGTPQP